jgi:hypothetical protein
VGYRVLDAITLVEAGYLSSCFTGHGDVASKGEDNVLSHLMVGNPGLVVQKQLVPPLRRRVWRLNNAIPQ